MQLGTIMFKALGLGDATQLAAGGAKTIIAVNNQIKWPGLGDLRALSIPSPYLTTNV